MTCIKTGCHLYSDQYDEFFYGDLFSVTEDGDTCILRAVARSRQPINNLDVIHARTTDVLQMWDMDEELLRTGLGGFRRPGTILMRGVSFDYNGRPNPR